jgi:hypothetical protein
MKLVRAEIPMCPECGAEVEPEISMTCPECMANMIFLHYGYYAPDVSGVVEKLRDISYGEDDRLSVYLTAGEARNMADRLEGKS